MVSPFPVYFINQTWMITVGPRWVKKKPTNFVTSIWLPIFPGQIHMFDGQNPNFVGYIPFFGVKTTSLMFKAIFWWFNPHGVELPPFLMKVPSSFRHPGASPISGASTAATSTFSSLVGCGAPERKAPAPIGAQLGPRWSRRPSPKMGRKYQAQLHHVIYIMLYNVI